MHEDESVEIRHRRIDNEVSSLGARLARRRRGRVSRTGLAAATGLDLGTLTRLEKSQIPTLTQLLRLCDYLGVSPWELLGSARLSWTRDRSVSAVRDYGAWELVGTSPSAVNPVELELGPFMTEPEREHDGVEWLYVVRGSVELRLAGGDPIQILERDAVDFDGAIPHRLVNLSDEPAVILRRMSSAGISIHVDGQPSTDDR